MDINLSIDLENNRYIDKLEEWFNEISDDEIENIDECKTEGGSIHSKDKQCSNNENEIIIIEIDDIIEKNPSQFTSYLLLQYQFKICFYVQNMIDEFLLSKKTKEFHSCKNSTHIQETDCDNNFTNTDNIIDNCTIFTNNICKDDNDSFKTINTDINCNMAKILPYLNWISLSAEVLANRIGQIPIENKFPDMINRSSYNFCYAGDQCKKYYSRYEVPTCKNHHYVHYLLKHDVDSVINFLNNRIATNTGYSEKDINEIKSSIKTVNFVSNHMASEIAHIERTVKCDSEIFHRSNPIEIHKNINRLSDNCIKPQHKNKTHPQHRNNKQFNLYKNVKKKYVANPQSSKINSISSDINRYSSLFS